MKQVILRIVNSLCILGVITAGLIISDELFLPESRWDEFYALEDDTIEIIFMGSSHAFNSFDVPLINVLLEVDGYCLATSGATIEHIYFQLVEIFRSQSPGVIVIEAYSLRDYDVNDYTALWVHNAFDKMKISSNKIRAIQYNAPNESRYKYIFPLTIYHNKWKSDDIGEIIQAKLYRQDLTGYYYGYTPVYYNELNNSIVTSNDITQATILNPERIKLLDQIVTLCRDNEAELFIVASPFIQQMGVRNNDISAVLVGLKEYALQNSVHIIDYNVTMDDISFSGDDLRNEGHLNALGASKMSRHFADMICKSLPNRLDDAYWNYAVISKYMHNEISNRVDVFAHQIEESTK